MASLSDFMAHVMPYAPGCSYPLAEQHIRLICIDFCTRAPIVQELLDPIDLVAGEAVCDVDTAPGTELSLVLQASLLGVPLSPKKTGDRGWYIGAPAPGMPTAYQQTADGKVQLNAAPTLDMPGALQLLVSSKPTRRASSVPDVLLNDYGYEIGQGVAGRLVLIPDQPFTAPGLSAAFTSTYTTARTEARIRAEASFSTAGTRVRPRQFI